MHVEVKDAGLTWLDWLRRQRGAGDAIPPDAQHNSENTSETVAEDGTFALKKFMGKQVGVTKPLLAVFLLVLLSGFIFRVSTKRNSPNLSSPSLSPHRLSSQNKAASLSPDDAIIRRYLDDLDKVKNGMEEAWDYLEQPAQEAFQKYFTPSHGEGQELTGGPLATISEHVAQMQECEFPSHSSAKVRKDFLQHVQLLLTICRMVTLRLEQLKWDPFSENKNRSPWSSFLPEEPDSNSDLEGAFGISSSVKADVSWDEAWRVGSEQGQLVGGEVDEAPDIEVPRSPLAHEEPDSNSGLEDPFGISSSMKADDFLNAVTMAEDARRQSVDGEEPERIYAKVPRSPPVYEDLDSNSGLEDPLGISSSMKADDFLNAVRMVEDARRQSVDGEEPEGEDVKVPRSPPVHEDLDSNSGPADTLDNYSLLTSAQFLESVGIFGGNEIQKVPIKLASRLNSALGIDESRNISNLDARYYFERFLQAFGEVDPASATPPAAKHQIPYSGKPFRTGALAQAAAQIFRQSEGNINYAKVLKMHRIADNWTPEGVKEATEQQEEANKYNVEQRLLIKGEQMRVLRKKGIQNSDLEMIALFLL
ncbi:hypothetical protein EMWEY_00031780 [Eimeria maxima]|uniref:Uncharacterized protein n=1 Tax=Eimeria maxima TaxID=5804 RepID=U6MFZ6_EIMMA|nr:hypothetical protein EMWEY_00031780 [Eimeria maxima]CDJ60550.1 hypothetical protein EMWEY_00031780 [Eimeria maxima]